MSEQSLKEKTVKGIGWSAIDSFLGHGITFMVGLVLARLLSPSEYGLIGLTTIFITVFNSIVDSGFSQALIRKKDAKNEDYNTMFITNIVLSFFMYLFLFISAPVIARFFEQTELISLIRVMGVVLIINALSITQNTILTKRIDFKTKTKASIISATLSGGIGIGMAFMGYGVWALVGQQITKQLTNTVCLWFFNRWLPNFSFSPNSFRYMWGFGWKLLASSLLDRIWGQLNQVIVGKFYSPATLGQYSKANEYASIFSANINSIVGRVSYPVLSEIQDDKSRLVKAYRRIIKNTMFITAVCMFMLGAVSEPLIYCLIGDKWHEAATYLPLICISGSLYPLHAINLNMLKVQGRSDLFLGLEIIKKIIALAPLFVGAFVGIMPMLCVNLFTSFICFFLNSYYSGKLIGYNSWMQIKDIIPSYSIATVMAFPVWFFKYLPISNWIILPLQIMIGTIMFFIVCKLTKLPEYDETKQLIMPFVQKFKKN